MLKIAVCDDEARDREKDNGQLRGVHKGQAQAPGAGPGVESGHELLKAVNAGDRFDLYILDVIMPEPGGIQTGLNCAAWERAAKSSI